ncbi:MAG: hypothetical protein ABW154_03860 [Dyella sp.]
MRLITLPLLLGLALPALGTAQQTEPAHDTERAPLQDDLSRYLHLREVIPLLPIAQQLTALQLLASVEAELGLYAQAVQHFPIDNRDHRQLSEIDSSQWRATDAVETITSLARDRRVVMLNEAHHDAATRLLTLALLPRLRAAGFTHFAVEALNASDHQLMQRGYPIEASGSEYLHEPIYGELVRTAIKLGFVVVAYDSEAQHMDQRESEQARHLYQQVLKGNPSARLLVHAGYAHIDKAVGRLGAVEPMAAVLQRLSGLEVLSIDQIQLRAIQGRHESPLYRHVIENYRPSGPIVLLNRDDGRPWSMNPTRHDANVILPWRSVDQDSRPDWLSLGGQRVRRPIDSGECREQTPCLIEARYAGETRDAIAADRYVFLKPNSHADLYLKPGRYQLRVSRADGSVLSNRSIDISAPDS